jgi:hypothetical protein
VAISSSDALNVKKQRHGAPGVVDSELVATFRLKPDSPFLHGQQCCAIPSSKRMCMQRIKSKIRGVIRAWIPHYVVEALRVTVRQARSTVQAER